MAKIISNTQLNNPYTQYIEGTTKWNQKEFSYTFISDREINWAKDDFLIENDFFGYDKPDLDKIESFDLLAPSLQFDTGKIDTIRNYEYAIRSAMSSYEDIADISFISYPNSDSYEFTGEKSHFQAFDFKYMGYDFPALTSNTGEFTAGQSQFPGDNPKINPNNDFYSYPAHNGKKEYESYLMVNTQYDLPTGEMGGGTLSHYVALHEMGHMLGLGHLNDWGNGSDILFNSDDKSTIDNSKYTVMSYNVDDFDMDYGKYGYNVTMSAFDIAAIQNMYGVNNKTYNGATTYTITDAQTADLDIYGSDGTVTIGRAIYTIWDAGGNDRMVYNGKQSVYLNLNQATLSENDSESVKQIYADLENKGLDGNWDINIQNNIKDPDSHAGGFVSQIFNTKTKKTQAGGYSIAKGARIESAIGGQQSDLLIGNISNNILHGRGGNDVIHASYGHDTIYDGIGNDVIYADQGDDILYAGEGKDYFNGGIGTDILNYSLSQNSIRVDVYVNKHYGDAAGDVIKSIEHIVGTKLNDRIAGNSQNNIFSGGSGNDDLLGFGGDDKIFGNNGNDMLLGFSGNDVLYGNDNNDNITGGWGKDTINGGDGNDIFHYTSLIDSYGINTDLIKDFETKTDKIYLNFDVHKSDILIHAANSYQTLSIKGTNFEIDFDKKITLSDIIIA